MAETTMDGRGDALPNALYRAEQVREFDRIAIEEFGVAGFVLMERAGAAAFHALRARWPHARHVGVVCGAGNNAGDGFVVARLAHEHGLEVTLACLGERERLKGDARHAFQRMNAGGVSPNELNDSTLSDVDVVVDGLLGIGLDRKVEGAWADAVAAMNRASAPVVSLDIPSGLQADTGRVLGVAVKADVTT